MLACTSLPETLRNYKLALSINLRHFTHIPASKANRLAHLQTNPAICAQHNGHACLLFNSHATGYPANYLGSALLMRCSSEVCLHTGLSAVSWKGTSKCPVSSLSPAQNPSQTPSSSMAHQQVSGLQIRQPKALIQRSLKSFTASSQQSDHSTLLGCMHTARQYAMILRRPSATAA